MTNICPNCGFNGEYDEMVMNGSNVEACMMCQDEPHPDLNPTQIALRKIWGTPLYLPPETRSIKEIWAV